MEPTGTGCLLTQSPREEIKSRMPGEEGAKPKGQEATGSRRNPMLPQTTDPASAMGVHQRKREGEGFPPPPPVFLINDCSTQCCALRGLAVVVGYTIYRQAVKQRLDAAVVHVVLVVWDVVGGTAPRPQRDDTLHTDQRMTLKCRDVAVPHLQVIYKNT